MNYLVRVPIETLPEFRHVTLTRVPIRRLRLLLRVERSATVFGLQCRRPACQEELFD